MSGLPHSTNPVSIARDTVSMAKETGSPTFEKVAKWGFLGTAALSALVAFAHTVRSLYRDFTRQDDSPRPVPQAAAPDDAETPPHRDGGHERSWVEKSRATSHEPQARHARHQEHGYGGRHER